MKVKTRKIVYIVLIAAKSHDITALIVRYIIRKTRQLTWAEKSWDENRKKRADDHKKPHAMQISTTFLEAPTLPDEPSRHVMKTMQENDTQRTEGQSAVYRRSQEAEQSRACRISQKPGGRAEQSRACSVSQKPGGRAEQSTVVPCRFRQPHLTKHQQMAICLSKSIILMTGHGLETPPNVTSDNNAAY
jgi:hypothetical protein